MSPTGMTLASLPSQPDHNLAMDRDVLALALANLASQAGQIIMQIYAQPFEVVDKADGTPLTSADLAADAAIAQGLLALAPHIPVLSEETVSQVRPDDLGERFFVVDPLDGTKEFIERNGDFSVNIALVEHGVPIVGAVYAPAHKRMWLAGHKAFAAHVEPGEMLQSTMLTAIKTCPDPGVPIRAVASRSHRDARTSAFLSGIKPCKTASVGSALKFCLVAEGKADVYPRFGPTMVWDTAAGIAVLQAAGGLVLDDHGQPMRVAFGPHGWRNGAFTAWGCQSLKDRTSKVNVTTTAPIAP